MHYLSDEHILQFLIQIFLLLTSAKIIGGIFQRFGLPSLAGEILTGILLGPTILGRFFPHLHAVLFPPELIQMNMLETVSWVGVLFLLLATGFEVSLTSAWKQGKAAFLIGIIGVAVPFALGMAVFWWLPAAYLGPAADRLIFTLFLSTAASISALAVIARILHDLEILKSDLGLATLSGFVVNDLLGWLIFALVLSFVSKNLQNTANIFRTFFEIIIFSIVCLTVGSRFVGFISKKLKAMPLSTPATILTFITCLAVLCGTITQLIGIHAILGFFLAGIMAGNTQEITERTRETISQMVHAVFVPLFFASIGLKVDFAGNLDLLLAAVFTAVAVTGKFGGAWLGAVSARMTGPDALSVGIAFIPGGAMEIVLGLLALQTGLVSETVFVAIVFAALFSSVAVGPLLARSLKRRREFDTASFLKREGIITDLAGRTKREILAELCAKASECAGNLDAAAVLETVLKRESIMGTGLEKGLAVPHGRPEGLKTPLIIFGRSAAGADWDCRDGLPARFIFLILTPARDEGSQVQILAAVGRLMAREEVRRGLEAAAAPDEIYSLLKTGCMEKK